MHPKMLGSGKLGGFVPIHDLEQRMGSFGSLQLNETGGGCVIYSRAVGASYRNYYLSLASSTVVVAGWATAWIFRMHNAARISSHQSTIDQMGGCSNR